MASVKAHLVISTPNLGKPGQIQEMVTFAFREEERVGAFDVWDFRSFSLTTTFLTVRKLARRLLPSRLASPSLHPEGLTAFFPT